MIDMNETTLSLKEPIWIYNKYMCMSAHQYGFPADICHCIVNIGMWSSKMAGITVTQ